MEALTPLVDKAAGSTVALVVLISLVIIERALHYVVEWRKSNRPQQRRSSDAATEKLAAALERMAEHLDFMQQRQIAQSEKLDHINNKVSILVDRRTAG